MRIQTKGPKNGQCNICGNYGPLTEDHIPPKGVCRIGQVRMMNIVDLLAAERPSKSSRYFQNGVKYRTLCSACNGQRLGLRYDPVLIALSNAVRSCFDSPVHLPVKLDFLTKPNRLVRSVVGHLLAHGVGEYRNGTMIEDLTDYFLDEKCPFPANINLYYWVYPYNDQVVVKGAALSPFYWNSFAVFMLLKFFPLGFCFIVDEPDAWRLPLNRLDVLLSSNVDDEVDIPVEFTNVPPQRWPEAPGNKGMVMYGEGATGAVPVP